MGSKKTKCKASSPAESHRPAPSRPVSPYYQDGIRSGTYTAEDAQRDLGIDSSDELNYYQEDDNDTYNPFLHIEAILTTMKTLMADLEAASNIGRQLTPLILDGMATYSPKTLKTILLSTPVIQQLIAEAISKAKAPAIPPPPPPPTMEVDPPTTPTGPKPPAPAPRSGHAPSKPTPAARAPKRAPPPPPSQPAPKLTYAAALGSKAPHPHKAHPPTKLVAPATTKWVAIPTNKSQLRDLAKRPSPHHIVGAINRKLQASAGEHFWGVHIANLGDSHILAASWTVGCNLLITAAKAHDHHGLDTPAYLTIMANALATIPGFSLQGATVIPYRPATRLQIKGLPTWDPSTNKPVELTSVFNTLDGLGIFQGVELITNSPAPSDALSWARDPSTFNVESRPCAVTICFYNNDSRETGALLKKAFYLLGHRRRFDKWQPCPPPPKKG
ncbi:hypothetical protein H0H81_002766 [Sphagnurus paluster]|uniref:Uncharacterized protein n=1 Tax=Sphagnurus paluster TaxID=117069 RepID=A0A9P7KGK1_9AGAR|nr:hypothetical protein H0H81_002766 [Sphagnurus paluster]